MKIVSLSSENIKKLVAVEITPSGNVVEITGKNGQGKTSILDSIWWALAGASTIQASPIRHGEEFARIKLDLGELIVQRMFKAKEDGGYTTSISVTNADGTKVASPQTVLDALMGELSFDPLAFSRMKPKDQFEELRKLVPGVDFASYDTKQKADYADRSEWNRRARENKALVDAIGIDIDGPVEPKNVEALTDKVGKAAAHNDEISARKMRRAQVAADIEARVAKATELRAQLDAMVKETAELRAKLDAAPPLPEPIDVQATLEEIKRANAFNDEVQARIHKRQIVGDIERAEEESQRLTAQMAAREEEKRRKVAEAKLPLPGLGFGDGVAMLNGVPFDQASDAEQLRASVAIAMALNPKLRVIRIRDGSLLDDESMKLLGEIADGKDFQVWVETVNSNAKTGFVIEAGRLKDPVAPEPVKTAAPAPAAPAPSPTSTWQGEL